MMGQTTVDKAKWAHNKLNQAIENVQCNQRMMLAQNIKDRCLHNKSLQWPRAINCQLQSNEPTTTKWNLRPACSLWWIFLITAEKKEKTRLSFVVWFQYSGRTPSGIIGLNTWRVCVQSFLPDRCSITLLMLLKTVFTETLIFFKSVLVVYRLNQLKL